MSTEHMKRIPITSRIIQQVLAEFDARVEQVDGKLIVILPGDMNPTLDAFIQRHKIRFLLFAPEHQKTND